MVFRDQYSNVMNLNANKFREMSTKSCKLTMRKLVKLLPEEGVAVNTFMFTCLSTLNNLSDIVLPDLNDGIKISIKNGALQNDSFEVLKKFTSDTDRLDVYTWFEERLEPCLSIISPGSKEFVTKTLRVWFKNVLLTWDQEMEATLIRSIKAKHVQKCSMQFGIFNFTDIEIGEDKLSILSKGHKAVTPLYLSQAAKSKRVEDELLNYARRYRLYIEKNHNDPEETVLEDWLTAASTSATSEEASNFYSQLKKSKANNKVEEYTPKSTEFIFTKKSLSDFLSFKGTIWNEADKGRGCVLLPIEFMQAAEKRTVNNMGGIPINLSREDLIKLVQEQIEVFNEELDGQQRAFVVESLGGITASDFKEIVVPFLNLKAKIHKLSDADIENKDPSSMKFRPVVDQSRWVLYEINRTFMSMIVNINSKIVEASRGRLDKILPKNGQEVASYFKDFKFSTTTSLKGMLSADLSDAYSNVLLHDLEASLESAAEITGLEAWKLELVISLARLILKNNFVETSCGYFRLTDCLAMGNSSSGACLDLVGLTREYYRVGMSCNITLDNRITNQTSSEINSINMSPLLSYKRYLDDTNGIFESDCPDKVMSCILGVGTMFPNTIEINVDLFHICGSFLDVVFVRKLATGEFVTLVRKELSSPPSYVPYSSAVPMKYKLSAMKSEMIRYRRVCSEEKFVKFFEQLLTNELVALGYTYIHKEMDKFRKEIKEKYDSNAKKLSDVDSDLEGMVFGSTSKVEYVAHTHTMAKNILFKALEGSNSIKLPMQVPSTKLKEILHTRRSYLEKMK